MSGYDQVLMIGSAIGVGMMVVALYLVRQLDKHERESAAEKAKTRPAE
jgi:hypothetical protein